MLGFKAKMHQIPFVAGAPTINLKVALMRSATFVQDLHNWLL